MGIFPNFRGENKKYLKPPPEVYQLAPEKLPSEKESSFPTIIFQRLC